MVYVLTACEQVVSIPVRHWKGYVVKHDYVKVYLMAILDNYMFRPLLAIFGSSSRDLKVPVYTLSAHVVQRSLYTGLIA